MNRSQKYVSGLLERLPKWELRSYEHQTTLDRIRDRITSSQSIQTELQSLYRVQGFSEFALSLMWIVERVEKDTSLEESTLAEETLVFEKLRNALGDVSGSAQKSSAQSQDLTIPSFSGNTPDPGPSYQESTFQMTFAPEPPPTPAVLDSWGMDQPMASAVQPAGSSSGESGQENRFAAMLERFLESVQSGNDDRTTLLPGLISETKAALNAGSSDQDFKQFCEMFSEFLQFVMDNQFIDDIRVMNIVSNVQDPVTQWVRTNSQNRSGLLTPALDILRDYKTMFE